MLEDDRNIGLTIGQQVAKLNQCNFDITHDDDDRVYYDIDTVKAINVDIKNKKKEAMGFTKDMTSAEELLTVIENW
jgi:hypothetical protein